MSGLGYNQLDQTAKKFKKKQSASDGYEFFGSVDDRGRRTWDTAAYERKAKYGHAGTVATDLKSDKRNLPPSKRDMLTARDYKVDLDSKVNRTSVVSMTDGGKDGSAGYYCEVCDCVIKDSMNYLDHINGRKHIQNLGMSMNLTRSTVEDVKKRFKMHKEKKVVEKKEYSLAERLADAAEEEERMAAYSVQVKKDRRNRKRNRDEEKRNNDLELKRAKRAMEEKLRKEHDALIEQNRKEEARKKAESRKNRSSGSESDEAPDEKDNPPPPPPPKPVSEDLLAAADNDDDMMAAMGFGGFGGSAKDM